MSNAEINPFWKTNPRFQQLKPYPFERLNALFNAVTQPSSLKPIHLSIGEPKHETPTFLSEILQNHFSSLSSYPKTQGTASLRETLANWLNRRYHIKVDANSQVLPVLGSREALFSIAQALINPHAARPYGAPYVLMPNPFYQIYEGAAYLAGAEPIYLKRNASTSWLPDWDSVSPETWQRTQLLFVCSPDNPTGAVLPFEHWQRLFELSSRYGFIIISDECYSEIYTNSKSAPLGALEAAHQAGLTDFDRLLVMGSLSKRSNLPGLRSGYVAGNAQLIKRFLHYRTYHGSAMSPLVSALSEAAWNDEAHVIENRRLYTEKFQSAIEILASVVPITVPDAGFYLWLPVPEKDDVSWAQRVWAEQRVAVLPGQFLSRDVEEQTAGKGYVRLALVDQPATTREALERLRAYF
ncbi:MAG: succinyldiaminopimelate transaminase [Pseudomonadota bacterium]